MKKVFLAFLFFILSCSQLNASEYINSILPGLWNIDGTSFVEKNFVRISFKIEGEMNQTTDILKNIDEDIDKIIDDNREIARDIVNADRRVLTSSSIKLELYILDKTGFDFKVWDDGTDNAIPTPILLPEARPTLSNPFELPEIKLDDLRLTITFTSEASGKLRVRGYADLDTVGVCEINADCALWRDGTPKPSLDKETSSGCNSNSRFGIFAALLILVLAIGRSKKFCSGRI